MVDVRNYALNGLKMKDNGDGTYSLYVIAEGISVGDVEIGAVEIKNDSDDTRAKVGAGTAANGLRTVTASDSPDVASLASILAKIIAAPATEAKQDTLITANHTDLGALATKLDTMITALGVANGHLAALEAGLPYHV